MKTHQIRIVGGNYRRTPIPVPDVTHLRPTPDRIRETLYNWVHHFWAGEFAGKRVLDLFAGTGALGFEAASRGVAAADLVEQAPAALKGMREVQARLQSPAVHIHAQDARAFLSALSDPRYDLVLLDPPFAQGWMDILWPALPRIVAPGGLLYVESESAQAAAPSPWRLLRRGKAGKVHYHLLQFAASHINHPRDGIDATNLTECA